MKEYIYTEEELIVTQNSELTWLGTIKGDLVCQFDFFKDSEGKYWINDITTFEPNNEKGFGTKMMEAAFIVYNEIYVSTAEKYEIKSRGIKGDLRYTNALSFDESDLKIFVDKLILKGIFKKEWVCHPFKLNNMK